MENRETASDIGLWALVKQGDTKAFVSIYNKYWEKAYAQAYWIILDQDVAKDLVQDLFVHLWEKREEINIEERVDSYVRIAIRNRVLNHIKKNEVRRKHKKAISIGNGDKALFAEDFVHLRELKMLYAKEIDRLPERVKEVYLLSRERDLSIKEIASLFSVSEQTVKNQISGALKRIRNGLELKYALLWLFLVHLGGYQY